MFDRITPKEFLLYKESEKNWQLLDVREEWEVNIDRRFKRELNKKKKEQKEFQSLTQIGA